MKRLILLNLLLDDSTIILQNSCPRIEHKNCIIIVTKSSFVGGMSEFLEGEVSLICRKINLIHGQGPGVCYLEVKRFK